MVAKIHLGMRVRMRSKPCCDVEQVVHSDYCVAAEPNAKTQIHIHLDGFLASEIV